MKTVLNRLIGALLIIAAIGGLAFSIFGLMSVWRMKDSVTETLTESVELLSNTLDTTAEGLVVTQQSLDGAIASVSALEGTVDTLTKSVQSTEPAVGAVATLLNEEMPLTIAATQNALRTAQESAVVIDSVLSTLDAIPLIGIDYQPEVPLHTALGDVSTSLGEMPASFIEMGDSLDDTAHELQILQVDLALMKDAVRQIEASLVQYTNVLDGYYTSLETMQSRLENIHPKIPGAVDMTAWALTLFLAWMAVAQLGLLTQGWELLTRREVLAVDRQPGE